jgi:hypothetical protein
LIELPEASVLSKQLADELSGKETVEVMVAQNPHKFAWYSGDPALYIGYLTHKRVEGAVSYGDQVELWTGDMALVFSDGVNLRFHPRKKVDSLEEIDKNGLFVALKDTLLKMMELGGRDTEKDIYGNPGGYTTIFSKNSISSPCKRCGSQIIKEAYLGGRVVSQFS